MNYIRTIWLLLLAVAVAVVVCFCAEVEVGVTVVVCVKTKMRGPFDCIHINFLTVSVVRLRVIFSVRADRLPDHLGGNSSDKTGFWS